MTPSSSTLPSPLILPSLILPPSPLPFYLPNPFLLACRYCQHQQVSRTYGVALLKCIFLPPYSCRLAFTGFQCSRRLVVFNVPEASSLCFYNLVVWEKATEPVTHALVTFTLEETSNFGCLKLSVLVQLIGSLSYSFHLCFRTLDLW
jgi:hypothetical protein